MGYVPSSAAREMATGQVAVAAEAAPVAVSADSTNAISANA